VPRLISLIVASLQTHHSRQESRKTKSQISYHNRIFLYQIVSKKFI